MKKNVIVLALAVFAVFGFASFAFADGQETVLATGASTSCSGNLTVASMDGGNYVDFSLTAGNSTRNFKLNPGFAFAQTMTFSKEERAAAHGNAADTKVTNTTPNVSKIKVICE